MLLIHIDAAFNPKTQEAGLAYYVQRDGQEYQEKIYLSKLHDNHLAEFCCLFYGLKWIQQHEKNFDQMIVIKTDSKIVAQSVEKGYVKSERYKYQLEEILHLIAQYKLLFVNWVPEKENRIADHLAKQALHRQGKVRLL